MTERKNAVIKTDSFEDKYLDTNQQQKSKQYGDPIKVHLLPPILFLIFLLV